MEAGEALPFEQLDLEPLLGHEGGDGRAGRSAADHDYIRMRAHRYIIRLSDCWLLKTAKRAYGCVTVLGDSKVGRGSQVWLPPLSVPQCWRGGRLRFISKSLAGCSLVRIVEEELIAVGIIDHQEPVAPPAV